MSSPSADTHMIVLPGGGYAGHTEHEGEPVARWLRDTGVPASVFRYPLNARHPAPLNALRAGLAGALAAAGAPHAVHVSLAARTAWVSPVMPARRPRGPDWQVPGFATTSKEQRQCR